jgi:hypothetical protein
MWNNMNHVQVSVQCTASWCISHPGIISENLGKAFQEITANEFIKFFKPGQKEGILIFAWGCRCPKVTSNIEIGNLPKQHDSFNEKEE